MKRQIIAAAALLISVAACAQESPVRFQPEPDFDSAIGREIAMVKPHDAFEGVSACRVVDAQFFQPVAMAEARKMLAPCVKAVSATYGTRVTVQEGTVAPQAGRMSAQVEVLMLQVPAGTGVESSVMKDLNRAVSLRGGRLLGHPVVVVPAERKTPQQALNECVLPMVVRDVANGDDFIRYYGGCLRRVAEFGIVEMQQSPSTPLGVMLLTRGDQPTIQSLTTSVQVPSQNGPVKVELIAYQTATEL